MIRRPFWLATGMVIGVGGTLWAEQRIRRTVQDVQDRLSPDNVVRSVARGAQQLPERLRAANMAASQERRRREGELQARLTATVRNGSTARRARHAAAPFP